MSNNSVKLIDDDDFEKLGEIAQRVITRGEPGIANIQNFPYGRIGKKKKYPSGRKDLATLLNPCAEITLEHREVCNLSETLPTVCQSPKVWLEACEHATFYSSTVSLLPTHQPSTNAIIAKNRRIGVGIIDFSGWKHIHGLAKVTRLLRQGYKVVRETNRKLNSEAGVPESIKVSCIKPGKHAAA